MARTKKSTILTTPKSKLKRKQQLAIARQCKIAKERGNLASIGDLTDTVSIAHVRSARTVVSSSSSSSTPDFLPSVTDSVLGNKTRTQFKHECFLAVQKESGTQSSSGDSAADNSQKRAIVDIACIDSLVKKLKCPVCENTSLSYRTDKKATCGLSVHGYVFCTECEETVEGTEGYLAEKGDGEAKKKVGGAKDFGVNRRAVFSSLVCGLGATKFNTFCEMMDLQGMHHKTFHKKADVFYNKIPRFETEMFSKTAEHVRKVHANLSGVTLSPDDVLDISVSFDGSWMTRGHTSHVGIGCIIDMTTGLCIDAHVVCNLCQICESTGKKLQRNKPTEYDAWLTEHRPKCNKNFEGKLSL